MNFIEKLKFMIEFEEGSSPYPYDDKTGIRVKAPLGNLTIGVGHNLDAHELSHDIIQRILEEDLEAVIENCYNFLPFMGRLTENRQLAVLDMSFQMGIKGFLKFEKCVEALSQEKFEIAADEIRNSLYHKQTTARAERKAVMVAANIFPYDLGD